MKTTSDFLSGIAIGLAITIAACVAQPASKISPESTKTSPSTVQVKVPTQQLSPSKPPTRAFAPFCQNSGSSCAAPDVRNVDALDTYCVKKIPYINILVDPGTTFEVLDRSGNYACADSGQKVDGKTVLTCTGKELFSFNLKLTNPKCSDGDLVTGTGQCQDGFGFDATRACCAAIAGSGAGSVTIEVNMGACPLPQQP